MKQRSEACLECPWRRSNHGKRTAGGFYTKRNLRRLWTGIRTGKAPGMSCHVADERGCKATDADAPADLGAESSAVCQGALVLMARELHLLSALGQDRYQALPGPRLTSTGAASALNALVFGGLTLPEHDDPALDHHEPQSVDETLRGAS